MEEIREQSKGHKFISCLSVPIIILVYAIGSTIIFYLIWSSDDKITSFVIVSSIIMFLILPWFIFIGVSKLFLTTVLITRNGISRKLFGFMYKREILWEELKEIRLIRIPSGGSWIFFSKISLEGMSIGKARKQKEQIQVAYSERLIKAIRKFTNKNIINFYIQQE